MTTPADLSKLRRIKGCGFSADETHLDEFAVLSAPHCDECLTLLVDAAREGAVEECAKVAESLDLTAPGNQQLLSGYGAKVKIAGAIRALLPPPSATATDYSEPPTITKCDIIQKPGQPQEHEPTCRNFRPPPAVKRAGENTKGETR